MLTDLQLMRFPASISIVSDSLMGDKEHPPPPCDAIAFILHPISDAIRRRDWTDKEKLQHLEALEITYTDMVRGSRNSTWWKMSELPHHVRHEGGREVLAARRNFAERSRDIPVSAPLNLVTRMSLMP